MRVGDDLVARYVAAIAARTEPTAQRSGMRERVEAAASASAPAGGMPSAGAGRTVEVLAIVQAIDRKARNVTLRGAKRTVVVGAPEGVDLAKLKVGDEVRALFVEAAVVSIERPAAK